MALREPEIAQWKQWRCLAYENTCVFNQHTARCTPRRATTDDAMATAAASWSAGATSVLPLYGNQPLSTISHAAPTASASYAGCLHRPARYDTAHSDKDQFTSKNNRIFAVQQQ